MSKFKQPSSSLKAAQRNQSASDLGKRDIAPAIQISGAVEARIPQALVDEYRAASKEASNRDDRAEERELSAERRDKRRFNVEVATLIVLFLYAGLTAIQSCQAVRSANIARESLHVSERAYLAVKDGHIHLKTSAMGFTVENIGHIPTGKTTVITHIVLIGESSGGYATISKDAIEHYWSLGRRENEAPNVPTSVTAPPAI